MTLWLSLMSMSSSDTEWGVRVSRKSWKPDSPPWQRRALHNKSERSPGYAISIRIANLEHPCALSIAIRCAAKLTVRLIAQGCSKLAIGECRLRISDQVPPARFVVQSRQGGTFDR